MNTKKAVLISLIVISISIITVMGFANAVYTTTNTSLQFDINKKQCKLDLHAKMFDNENVPKYFIGGDYSVIPVDPTTTDIAVSNCNLES